MDDARNDALLCWMGPTNCQPKWLSELEVQRYGMKINTLVVDPIMLQDELWMKQRENRPQTAEVVFFENRTAETEFSVFEFWGRFGSVFRKPISEIFIGFRTSLLKSSIIRIVDDFSWISVYNTPMQLLTYFLLIFFHRLIQLFQISEIVNSLQYYLRYPK